MASVNNPMSEKTASSLWGCCKRKLEDEKFAKCNKCKRQYHYVCLSFIENYILPPKWLCAECLAIENSQSRNVSTTRGNKRPALNSPPQMIMGPMVSSEEVRKMIQDIMQNELKEQLCLFNEKFNDSLNRKLQPIKEDIAQMNDSMTFMNSQYEDLLKEHTACKETMKELQTQNSSMKQTIGELNDRLNRLEQQTRSNNIEIQCLPERKSENLVQVVTDLAKVVGYNLADRDIMHCSRVAKQNPKNTRPRSVVLQLSSPRVRDHFLAAAISYNKTNQTNKLNSTHLGCSGPKSPIYITEHLSTNNKALHAAARFKAKEIGYQFVWVRGGRIFMRKDQDTEYILIRNLETLNRLV